MTETESIHAARWVNQLKDTGWEVHVFQAVVGNAFIHPEFEFGVFHVPKPCPAPTTLSARFTLPQDVRFMEGLTKLEAYRPGLMQKLHERYLEDLIRLERPEVVHSLGLNINWTNMCLPVLRARISMGDEFRSPWLYSSWGTNLSFYAHLNEENLTDVKSVLRNCDYLVTEHSHDRNRANELGFGGKFVGYFTGFGGIETQPRVDKMPPSARKTILLKGRDISDGDPVGRANVAIRAFRLCQDVLANYRIAVVSASTSRHVVEETAMLTATTDLKVQVLPYLSSEHLMEIYGASRVFISLTVNDGIPRSLLEAMAYGAYPILGSLDSLSDLVVSGENGFLVPPENPEAVACALRQALTDDNMVDMAARRNGEIIERDFDENVVRQRVVQMYRDIAYRFGAERTGMQLKDGKADIDRELSWQPLSMGKIYLPQGQGTRDWKISAGGRQSRSRAATTGGGQATKREHSSSD